jgi:hypothetical protein
MQTVNGVDPLSRFGYALSDATRAEILSDHPARPRGCDLVGLVLDVDPACCPHSAEQDCC